MGDQGADTAVPDCVAQLKLDALTSDYVHELHRRITRWHDEQTDVFEQRYPLPLGRSYCAATLCHSHYCAARTMRQLCATRTHY